MGNEEYSGYEDSSDEETTNSTEKEAEIESRLQDSDEQINDQVSVNAREVQSNDGEIVTDNNEYSNDPRNLIQDVFELFQLEFQSSVNDSFQRVSDCADKFQFLDQELYELSGDVTAEHYTLKEKKRRAVDSVESLKKRLMRAATEISEI